MANKLIHLQVAAEQLSAVRAVVKQLEVKYNDWFQCKEGTGDIIDTVFHPAKISKVVYTVPTGKCLLSLTNNFDKHKELAAMLRADGVEVTEVVVTYQ